MEQTRIYSIGYGHRKRESFIDKLKKLHISHLVDVRSIPYSKFNPDFSQNALKVALAQYKIQYIFMGDSLGGRPEDPSCYTNGYVDYKKIEEKKFFLDGIERIVRAHKKNLRIALMCSEKKPHQCHRSKLLGVYLNKINLPIHHIDENDDLISQEEVLKKITCGQRSLFETDFKSRKKYGDSP